MTIRHFQIFAAVCEERSITKAAESLYMTQPAVSKAIKELSEQCAFVLFEKVNGKLRPTEDALELLADVSELLDLFKAVENKFYHGLSASNVNIGCNMPIGVGLMFDTIEQFEKTYPHTRFNIFEDKWPTIKQRLFDREIDFAIVTGYEELFDRLGLAHRLLSQVEFCWVCGSTNKIARESHVSLARLAEERLALPDYAGPESFADGERIDLRPSWTTVNMTSTLKAVSDMDFVSYLPLTFVQPYLDSGALKRIDADIGHFRNLYYVYLPKHRKKKFYDGFFRLLQELISKNSASFAGEAPPVSK